MTNIEESICKAVDVILKKRLSELQFDKTVVATIIDTTTDNSGRYLIQYQDIKFYAYALNGAKYKVGDVVYILTPENNSTRNRFILSHLGVVKAEEPDPIEIDDELSLQSKNPVQNKIITEKINEMEEEIKSKSSIIVDTQLDITSHNAVENMAIAKRINEVEEKIPSPITIDTELNKTSTNPVQNKAVAAELEKLFQSVSDGKKLIASAITDKGVICEADETFLQMAEKILRIAEKRERCEFLQFAETFDVMRGDKKLVSYEFIN